MPQHHPSQAQYQSMAFSGYASQGCQQNISRMSTKFPTSGILIIYASILISSIYVSILISSSSTSNVFYGHSQRFDTTFNTPSFVYNLSPSSSYHRLSLPTQMRDMIYENEEEDDDNNNINNNEDDDHVSNNNIITLIILDQEEIEVIEQEDNKMQIQSNKMRETLWGIISLLLLLLLLLKTCNFHINIFDF